MLVKLFLFFLKVSAFTLGGGYAMILVIERELIGKKWITEDDIIKIVSIAQSIPGPVIFNASFLVGRQICGIKGGFVSVLGVIIPPFVAIVAIASFVLRFSNIEFVAYFLKGTYAAAIALLVGMIIKTFKRQRLSVIQLVILLSGGVVVFFYEKFLIPVFFIISCSIYFTNLMKRGDDE